MILKWISKRRMRMCWFFFFLCFWPRSMCMGGKMSAKCLHNRKFQLCCRRQNYAHDTRYDEMLFSKCKLCGRMLPQINVLRKKNWLNTLWLKMKKIIQDVRIKKARQIKKPHSKLTKEFLVPLLCSSFEISNWILRYLKKY